MSDGDVFQGKSLWQCTLAAMRMMLWSIAGVWLMASAAGAQTMATVPVVHARFPTGAATPLGAQVDALLADPVVSRAHWGIAVTALDGTPIYGLDEGKLFRPASTAKLFTAAAAMALLGPTKTFETIVRGDVDKSGVVNGPLDLVGGGDANLDSSDIPYLPRSERPTETVKPPPFRDLESLADQLVAKGVTKIRGKIEAQAEDSPWDPYPEGWEEEDLIWGYGAPVSGLILGDNQLKLTIRPGRKNGDHYDWPQPELEQNGVPFYKLKVEGQTDQKKEYWAGLSVDRGPGSRVLRIYGYMAANSVPDVEEVAVEDPMLFAAMAFRNILMKKGIEVVGEATSYHWQVYRADDFLSQLNDPGACGNHIYGTIEEQMCPIDRLVTMIPVLATHDSPMLAEDIKFTLKTSQNLHAEVMLRNLGLVSPNGIASTIEGARIVRQFLIHAGVDQGDFIFYDGSGLSTKDLVTPRATAQLLAFAAKQPWFAQWKPALPIGGVDGTLEHRFTEAPLKGHVFAKTGTLGESRALAGYVDCASGKQVIFSIMVDDHTPGSSADRGVMDKIVAAIAAAN
jgi:D-alanyl-D-alanine carboxypeptidase/D-alanyl-D-alanine-endopeptidase (penicillin-binding protein 4)